MSYSNCGANALKGCCFNSSPFSHLINFSTALQVELNCATAFDELDRCAFDYQSKRSAISLSDLKISSGDPISIFSTQYNVFTIPSLFVCRSNLEASLQEDLTPEQFAVLFQGTAGMYQDLKSEIRRQMQSFEEYALEEILKVPVGLMADFPENEASTKTGGDGSGSGGLDDPEMTLEEEQALEEQLKTLRQQITAAKRRTRDMQSTCLELDQLMISTQHKVNKLESVPAALAGKEKFTEDVKAITDKGAAVEAGCVALDTIYRGGEGAGAGAAVAAAAAMVTDDVTTADALTAKLPENMTDAEVEREILKRQAAVKSAPAEDLRAINDQLQGGGGGATS